MGSVCYIDQTVRCGDKVIMGENTGVMQVYQEIEQIGDRTKATLLSNSLS